MIEKYFTIIIIVLFLYNLSNVFAFKSTCIDNLKHKQHIHNFKRKMLQNSLILSTTCDVQMLIAFVDVQNILNLAL